MVCCFVEPESGGRLQLGMLQENACVAYVLEDNAPFFWVRVKFWVQWFLILVLCFYQFHSLGFLIFMVSMVWKKKHLYIFRLHIGTPTMYIFNVTCWSSTLTIFQPDSKYLNHKLLHLQPNNKYLKSWVISSHFSSTMSVLHISHPPIWVRLDISFGFKPTNQ